METPIDKIKKAFTISDFFRPIDADERHFSVLFNAVAASDQIKLYHPSSMSEEVYHDEVARAAIVAAAQNRFAEQLLNLKARLDAILEG